MSFDFQAFSTSVVLDISLKITVLENTERKLLAGLTDGTLLVLQPDEHSDGNPWQVVQTIKAFGKKHILQLQACLDGSMLLSLDEEGVSLLKLPGLTLHCLANRTKNAHLFAWQASKSMLAVAVKRKLLLFHFNGNEFVEQKELGMPEPPLRLAWVGNFICLGLKKEYTLVNSATGALTEVFKHTGRPCITPVGSSTELLLAKGNVGIFVGQDGKISRRSSLPWSDSPLSVAFSHPYAVALLTEYIEIRSVQRVSDHGLAQILPLRCMTVAAPSVAWDGSVMLASGSEGGIQRLAPVSFRRQAEVLADAGEFQEALQLALLIPDSQEEERIEVNNELHTRLGHRLFAEGEFDEAMAHFGMCSEANPLVLLRLFPSLAPTSLLEPLQESIAGYKLSELPEPTGDSYQKAVEVLLPYLLSHRSRLASMNSHDAGRPAPDSNPDQKAETCGATAGSRKAGQLSVRHMSDEQRQLLAAAIDTSILKAMLATSDSGALLRYVQRPNCVSLAEGEAALQSAGRFSELVALYQARGKHEAALDLLKRVSQSPQDLPVSPKGAAAELAGVTGVWAAVKYLVTVGAKNLELVKRHARWILKADPEAGLEMFIQLESALPPSAALPILTAQAPSLCAPYLETALANGIALPKEYHNDLAGIYLRVLLNPSNNSLAASSDNNTALSVEGRQADGPGTFDAMQRLKDLVLNSKHIDAQRLLLMLPSGQLPELRALLLERIGQHQEALRLYVHTMRNPGLAEAYCDRMYDAVAKQHGRSTAPSMFTNYGDPSNYDMYLALIQVFLEQRCLDDQPGDAPNSSNWGEVAHLLGRKHDRIEPMHALKLVPEEVSLLTVLPFLEGSLRSTGEQRRNASVVRSLRRSENLNVREENVQCKQRWVLSKARG